MDIHTIAIVGMGLLGTSFGYALRNRGFRRLCWSRNPETRQYCVEHGAADETADSPDGLLARADITFLALPIPAITAFLQEHADAWRPGSIVCDMGSVKTVICACAERTIVPRGVVFVGTHPMAGTEKSGCRNALPELYENADVFLCPGSNAPDTAVTLVENLWRSLNTHTFRITPPEHDNLVAHTSHVLHIVASALSLTILDGADTRERQLRFAGCATGFRDTSRIASSNPEMWREIIENNTPANLEALENFERKLRTLRFLIANGDYDAFQREFAHGKLLRDSWLEYKSGTRKDETER